MEPHLNGNHQNPRGSSIPVGIPKQGSWFSPDFLVRVPDTVYGYYQNNAMNVNSLENSSLDLNTLELQGQDNASSNAHLGTESSPPQTVDDAAEEKQRRMIKNREAAHRSRAKKKAYFQHLEQRLYWLKAENEYLKKKREVEKRLDSFAVTTPRIQLRRTSSAPSFSL